METERSEAIVAVIVSFNPGHDRLRALLEAVAPQVARVVVVDNGSARRSGDFLFALKLQLAFELIEFGQNRGIAAAHNAGIRYARDQGYGYVLLLDHDSLPAPGCVAELLKAHRKLVGAGTEVAAVGPRYLDETSGVPAPFLRYTRWNSLKIYPGETDEVLETSVLISSGSLISVQAIDAIGLMDEALFIDGVDWDWCFRASSLGYRLYGIAAASMTHSLGDSGIRIFKWKIPLHSPLRHYYAYRNTILLCKRRTVPFSWKLHFSARLVARFVIYMVLSPHRLKRCHYILRGLVDGLGDRSGPMQASRP